MSVWTIRRVNELLDSWYPPATAEDWDRVGLIVGDPDQPVKRILLAVDPVAETGRQAVETQADLMITHHPLYLRGTSFLPTSNPKGALTTTLIKHDIGLLNAHTNADVAVDGVSEALANLLGLRDQTVLHPLGQDRAGHPIGHGRLGRVQPQTVDAFAHTVARALPGGPNGILVGGNLEAEVRTVAVSGGAGDSFLAEARLAGADVFVTADLRHHPASEHLERGAPALICGSHWATEWPWLPVLKRLVDDAARHDGVQVEVEVSTIVTEPWVKHLATGGTR